MRTVERPGHPPYLQFETFPTERLRHGIFTRHGGVSPSPWASLNFSVTVGDSADRVARNSALAHAALGLDPARTADRNIAHTSRIWHVGAKNGRQAAPRSDGAVTGTDDLPLLMTFADCLPILAYDPVQHRLGVAHAGWRGTVDGVALSLVHALRVAGSEAADLLVGLGPAIGPCCYEVGENVAARARAWPAGDRWLRPGRRGRPHFDLAAANEAILRRAGVRQIERAGHCTACRVDLFFSHRGEPPLTGRFALLAALAP